VSQDIFERIKQQVEKDRIVLYMKGTPALPQCGFSQVTAEILRRLGVKFQAYDVLQDAALREESSSMRTGRRFRSSTSTENSSAAATSCARCTSRASCRSW